MHHLPVMKTYPVSWAILFSCATMIVAMLYHILVKSRDVLLGQSWPVRYILLQMDLMLSLSDMICKTYRRNITKVSHTTEKHLMIDKVAAREAYGRGEIANVGLIL